MNDTHHNGWLRKLVILSLCTSLFASGTSIVLYLKTQNSRQQAAFDACVVRTTDKRDDLGTQMIQTQGIPSQAFAQFGTTKERAIEELQQKIDANNAIDCKEFAKEVVNK